MDNHNLRNAVGINFRYSITYGDANEGNGDIESMLGAIKHAEKLGIESVWMTMGGTTLDGLTTLAVAARETSTIRLGTAIIPLYSRHPLVVVQQVQAVARLARDRLRVGIGPSHRALMESQGVKYGSPLNHLREYLIILKTILSTGKVDFEGEYYKATETISQPLEVPIMASALRRKSFELCGELTDGAIPTLCPASYLKSTALPALTAGAIKVGRTPPPIIAHYCVCIHDDIKEIRAAVRSQIQSPKLLYNQLMLVEAGFPEAISGEWSNRMIDNCVVFGTEEEAKRRVEEIFSSGVRELILSPIAAGADKKGSIERTTEFVAGISRMHVTST